MAEKYYEFIYLYPKPSHFGTFAAEFKKRVNFFEKHGVKVVGIYSAVLGGLGEYLAIAEYDSPVDKLAKMRRLMEDEEHKSFDAFHDMVDHINSVGLKNLGFHPYSPPDSNHPLSIRRYDLKGNPYAAAQNDFNVAIKKAYEDHLKPIGVNLVGAFLGTFGENTNSYYAVWDLSSMEALKSFEDVGNDIFKNMPDLSREKNLIFKFLHILNMPFSICEALKMWSNVTSVSCKIYMPIK